MESLQIKFVCARLNMILKKHLYLKRLIFLRWLLGFSAYSIFFDAGLKETIDNYKTVVETMCSFKGISTLSLAFGQSQQ